MDFEKFYPLPLTFRARLIRAVLPLWPFAFAWYRLTQIVSRWVLPTAKVVQRSRTYDAVSALGRSSRYRADRRALDVMLHPTVVQARIDSGARVGDCEDHAGYIVSSVRDGAERFAFSVQMFDPTTGEVSGHFVQASRLPGGGFAVADYGPELDVYGWSQHEDSSEWSYPDPPCVAVGRAVARSYALELLGVTWCPVKVDSKGGVWFRYRRGGHWKNNELE